MEEWFWRPAAIVSYSAERLAAQASTALHGTLSEMGLVVTSITIAVGPIGQTLTADGALIGESRQGSRTGVPAGRSYVVGRSGKDATAPQATALLIAGCASG